MQGGETDRQAETKRDRQTDTETEEDRSTDIQRQGER